jgi:3-oxoadipate enol-lactonase
MEWKRSMADGIPGSRLVVLERAAHLANVEQPRAFTLAVLEHLWR